MTEKIFKVIILNQSYSLCPFVFLYESFRVFNQRFFLFLKSFLEGVVSILTSFAVVKSFAVTFRIPLVSILNVTSIFGTPRNAGGKSTRANLPIETFSIALARSP